MPLTQHTINMAIRYTPARDPFAPVNYQKWGLFIGLAGLAVAVTAFVLNK